jgi:dTDP-4-amino-4,6-dideoxygalactose transaminase
MMASRLRVKRRGSADIMSNESKSTKNIPISLPFLGEAEQEAVCRPLASGWVTQGPEVAAFEKEFADYTGATHACAVSNCTTGLHLALKGVGVEQGDEVITVSHSFIATTNAVRYCGAMPVFVDIDPLTFNIDPAQVEAAITEKTKAILCVHQIGMPCDLAALLPLAQRHGLPLIEDAACAIGSEILWNGQWEKIGKAHGTVACFSFHPRKVLTTGDGGMLTTNDSELDRRCRLWRQHCMSVTDAARHGSQAVIIEEYTELGYNYRMTDIQAAIGREQLKRLPDIIVKRRALDARYRELLAKIDGLHLPYEPEWARSNWQSYCVRLPEHSNQRHVMQYLKDHGVASKTGVMCAHLEPACQNIEIRHTLERSVEAQNQHILIPLYVQMTEEDQLRVAQRLNVACATNK